MKKSIIILFYLISVNCYSQGARFDWSKSFGGREDDSGFDLQTDEQGNIYLLGSFSDTINFDTLRPGFEFISNGQRDYFMAKLNNNGDPIWVKTFGGSGWDLGRSFDLDSFNNIYITGGFYDTVDFDPGINKHLLIAVGMEDIFIQKLDSNGNLVWAHSMGSTGTDKGLNVHVGNRGKVTICGHYSNGIDFDPSGWVYGQLSQGSTDGYILQFDTSGKFEWVRSIAGPKSNVSYGITKDSKGDLLITGGFSGTTNFDVKASNYSMTPAGYSDIFITKIRENGDFVWAKAIKCASRGHGQDITVDQADNIYLVGDFYKTADFDPHPHTQANRTSSIGLNDYFVLKLNNDGEFNWVKTFGDTEQDEAVSIDIDHLGDLYITGFFGDTVDFDPGPKEYKLYSNYGHGVFLQKLDTSGNFIWAKSVIGLQGNMGYVISVDKHRNIFASGTYNHQSNFDRDYSDYIMKSNGKKDGFLMKFHTCIKGDVDTSISYTFPSLLASSLIEEYQWLNCDSNHAIINGETNRSFIPTVNGNYAVEVLENNCIDTTSCLSISNVSLSENGFGSGLSIYPNPTSGSIRVRLGSSYYDVVLTIRNALGQVVSENSYPQVESIDTNIEGSLGVYFIDIASKSGKRVTFKVLKE